MPSRKSEDLANLFPPHYRRGRSWICVPAASFIKLAAGLRPSLPLSSALTSLTMAAPPFSVYCSTGHLFNCLCRLSLDWKLMRRGFFSLRSFTAISPASGVEQALYISAEWMNVWLWTLVSTAPPLKSHLVNKKILGIKSRTFYFCHVVAFRLYSNFVKYALPLTSPSSFSAFLLYSFHCIVSSHSFEQILNSTHSSDSKV